MLSLHNAMEHQNQNDISLYRALEAKGWFWLNECFYPPHKTFWFEGDDFPQYVLPNLYLKMKSQLEKMKSQLEKMSEMKYLYSGKEEFEKWVEDTQSLVATLKELLEGNNASG